MVEKKWERRPIEVPSLEALEKQAEAAAQKARPEEGVELVRDLTAEEQAAFREAVFGKKSEQ